MPGFVLPKAPCQKGSYFSVRDQAADVAFGPAELIWYTPEADVAPSNV
jgi:hypothetical protein